MSVKLRYGLLVMFIVALTILSGCFQKEPATETLEPTQTPTPILTTALIVNAIDDRDDGTCDTTHCSLREAINAANNRPGPDTIPFDPTVFPLSGTGMIKLISPLPGIDDGGTTIDATGAKVVIDGGNLAEGLLIRSSGNTVRGTRITRVTGDGISIRSKSGWRADNNTLIGVTVVNNGYGPPSFTGRWDGITIGARGVGSSASRNKVINCTIEDNADDGIIVEARDGGVADDNIIMSNVIRGNGENGVEIDAEIRAAVRVATGLLTTRSKAIPGRASQSGVMSAEGRTTISLTATLS